MADLHLYLASQSLFNGFDPLKAYQSTHFLNPIFNLNLSLQYNYYQILQNYLHLFIQYFNYLNFDFLQAL
jgi:hypothetical protein